MSAPSGPLCGGISGQLAGDALDAAVKLLNTSLTDLAAKGPTLKVDKIVSVTSQVVAGMLYRYKVDLVQGEVVKHSEVEILSQPWIQEKAINIKIRHEGEDNAIEVSFQS